ncbi:MAG: phosphatidate cytidylyltransferase, partial [Bacilli bacterium]|nr:phosphatidate cytidylyltransferase [Bacilli bacterium]
MTKRVISAVVLVLLIVPLLFVGGLPFNILLSALSICALYEMFHMKENKEKLPLIIKVIAYILVVFLTYNTVHI